MRKMKVWALETRGKIRTLHGWWLGLTVVRKLQEFPLSRI
jgi:hypothetical protein